MTTVLVRHPELRLTEVDNEGVVLHLGSMRYFSVNETGLAILNALETPRSFEEVVDAVTAEFEVTQELAERTTRAFLSKCIASKLVHEEER